MAKISLNKLNLDKTSKTTNININGQEIEVANYLSLREKFDIIEIAINESMNGTYCNPMMVDALFHTYLVLSYTNITLSPSQKENLMETYDLMEKSGLIAEVVNAIPEDEYACIRDSLYECIEVAEKESNSIISIIAEAMSRVSDAIEDTKGKLSELDLNSESIQTVLKIAKDNGAI